MSTNLYIGINGSGKSYEVVTVVILGALRQGRRVVSNIAGLNYEGMVEILLGEEIELEKIGSILQVTHDDVLKENFFRTDADDETGYETIIQPGDVVCLDEIWRFWPERNSLTLRQLNFFRMHRHMLHPTLGFSCEIVLLTQLLIDVQPKIRGLVDKTYSMTKHTDLGMDKRYRVDVYSRARFTSRTEPLNQYQRTYNPAYFHLYKSHSVSDTTAIDAKEERLDTRGNIWSKPIIKYGFPLSIVCFAISGWFVWGLLHPKQGENPFAKNQPAKPSANAPGQKPDSLSGSPVPPVAPAVPALSEQWRIMGWYVSGKDFVVSLKGQGGIIRFLHNPPEYKFQARDLAVKLPEGGFVTTYSGVVADVSKGSLK